MSTTFYRQLENYKESIYDYSLGSVIGRIKIGEGSFAIVKEAVNIKSNEKVAIKIYDYKKLNDFHKRTNIKKEINILNKLNHKNIVKLLNVIEENNHVQ